MAEPNDIKTPADAFRKMSDLLSAVSREAARVGSGELTEFCARAQELVDRLLRMETH